MTTAIANFYENTGNMYLDTFRVFHPDYIYLLESAYIIDLNITIPLLFIAILNTDTIPQSVIKCFLVFL
jgi:hypothetical protein